MARITELALTPPGKPTQRVTREAASGDWLLTGPDQAGGWPVKISNIQAALRFLCTLEGREAEASTRPPGPGDAEVRLTLEDGSSWTLWVAARSLGGERLARIQPPGNAPGLTVLVDGAIFDALLETGPASWRLPIAFSDLSADVARITLTAVKGRIVLGRVAGRWGLQEPVSAPADDKAVQTLLKNLSGVHIERFLDAPPDPAAAHFDSPIATATLVSERRIPRGDGFETVTTTRTLTVGGPASIDGKDLYARVDGITTQPGGEPRATSTNLTISRETVEAVSMDAASYLTPAAIAVPAGEVGSVAITGKDLILGYTRTVDGWDPDSPFGAAGDNERIAALLKLLCELPAETRVLNPPPAPTFATVKLASLGGSPLAEVAIGLSGSLGQPDGQEGPPKLFVVSGQVARLYDPAPYADLLGWLAPAPTPAR